MMARISTEYWEGRPVFLTGATGFLGSHLTRRLVRQGAKVTVFVRPDSNRLRIKDVYDRIEIAEGDILETDGLKKALRAAGPKTVFHMAAAGVSAVVPAQVMLDVNAKGTFNIADACSEIGLDRFVFLGSCGEYGDGRDISEEHALLPPDVYGASKVAGFHIVNALHKSRGLPAVTARPFATYGPWTPTRRLIPHAIFSALEGRNIELRSGESERDFIYIDDVLDGLLAVASRKGIEGMAFNLCSGRGVKVKEMVEQILDLLGHPVKMILGSAETKEGEMNVQSGANELAERLLDWTPAVSLEQGLSLTIHWYRENMPAVKELSRVG